MMMATLITSHHNTYITYNIRNQNRLLPLKEQQKLFLLYITINTYIYEMYVMYTHITGNKCL